MGFPGGLRGEDLACQNKRRSRLDPWAREDSPGGGNGSPLRYSGLEHPTDREAWGGLQSTGLQRGGRASVTRQPSPSGHTAGHKGLSWPLPLLHLPALCSWDRALRAWPLGTMPSALALTHLWLPGERGECTRKNKILFCPCQAEGAILISCFYVSNRFPPFFDDNAFGIYQKILAGKIDFPRHLEFTVK